MMRRGNITLKEVIRREVYCDMCLMNNNTAGLICSEVSRRVREGVLDGK